MSKSQDKSKDIILSYHDCLLRQNDIDLLSGPYWLNDAIIGFYFEYLGQKYAESSSKLLFISPELTQLLKLTDPHEYPIFLDPIEAKKKEFIFFPVNDCNSRNASGGSHWSFMVFSKTERTCFSFDSSYGCNTSVAQDFSRDIMSYLLDKGTRQFVEMNCKTQENCYDCGLYVLCYADIITEFVLKTFKVKGCDCSNVNRLVSEKRRSLINLIERLK